jgi:hypothetical protein
VVRRNTLANAAAEDSWTYYLIEQLEAHREDMAATKAGNRRERKRARPNHGNGNAFAANWSTQEELAALIFRLGEWMLPAQELALEEDAPSDEEARGKRRKKQEKEAEKRAAEDDGEEDEQEERSEEGVRPKRRGMRKSGAQKKRVRKQGLLDRVKGETGDRSDEVNK